MKINKILCTIILFVILIMSFAPYNCYAAQKDDTEEGGKSTTVTGDSDKKYPTLDNSYKPKADLGSAQNIISSLLGVLTVVGAIVVVVGIALIGFGSILGSAGEKAEAQTKLVGVIIAGVVITSGSLIAKLIISAAESIG